jgi:hypothetical protein
MHTDCFDVKDNSSIKFYTTEEGLLLTTNSKITKITAQELANSNYNEMILSEIDGVRVMNDKQANDLDRKICEQLQALLQLLKFQNNIYEILYDKKNTPLVVYIAHNTVFLPKCVVINKIEIIKSRICYNAIPVKVENKTYGFLNMNRIISQKAERRECNGQEIVVYLPQSHQYLIQQDNETLFKNTNNVFNVKDLYRSFEKLKINHYSMLTAEIHHNAKIFNTDLKAKDFDSEIRIRTVDESLTSIQNVYNYIQSHISKLMNHIKYGIYIAVSLLILYVGYGIITKIINDIRRRQRMSRILNIPLRLENVTTES